MTGSATFRPEPFWDYSLSVYARPGVADAAIALQDEFGVDVNILLACCWCAAAGPGRLDSEHLRACVERTREWQSRVVEPLRNVRRILKTGPAPVPEDLRAAVRPAVQSIELDAEHVEQLLLADILREVAGAGEASRDDSPPAGRNAIQNLLAYFALRDVALTARAGELLATIVSAAFEGTDTSPLETS